MSTHEPFGVCEDRGSGSRRVALVIRPEGDVTCRAVAAAHVGDVMDYGPEHAPVRWRGCDGGVGLCDRDLLSGAAAGGGQIVGVTVVGGGPAVGSHSRGGVVA